MNTIIKKIICLVLFLAMPLTTPLCAQSIVPQKLVFSKICAGVFNEFDAVFSYSGFPAGTTFTVELSDNTGSFVNPLTTTTVTTTDISGTQKKIRFAVPTTLQGSENYKLRVKSSTGIFSTAFLNAISNTSFPVYYKAFEAGFSINEKATTASLCEGKTIVIAVDNTTPSPVNYSYLKYKWYKDNVLISGATSPSLTLTTKGLYYTEIDYGSCSDANISSNRVSVDQASTTIASITSSLGNSFCTATASTLLSTEKGNSYQWYKDNSLLTGETNQTYATNQPGNYAVVVNFGGCESKATTALKAIGIKGIIDSTSPIIIPKGGDKTVTVTTDVSNAVFSWFKEGVLLPNATTNYLHISEEGNYKVKCTHPSCPVFDEISFVTKLSIDPNSTAIPNIISPNNDGINDTWQLPQQYTSGNDVEVVIVSPNGDEVVRTKEYLNNWPDNSTSQIKYPIYYYSITSPDKAKIKGSITVVK